MIDKTQDNTNFVINETIRASSYEFGKAGNRFKLYFDNVSELTAKIDELIKAGLYVKEVKEA